MTITSTTQLPESFMGGESFEALLNASKAAQDNLEGSVLKGIVVEVRADYVIVDVGLKSEGYVASREFTQSELSAMQPGDEVDVYLERLEDKDGHVVLSREKARREKVWGTLEEEYKQAKHVMGVMTSRVKGGFTVDLSGVVAFLPGSQVDIRPIKDVQNLMDIEQPFAILKMDRSRGNIVVSRRAVLEESLEEARDEILSGIQEGKVLTGVVKNITDYGAFIDLGGVDGLLHITDISWKRINHPSEVLKLGQSIEVQVIRYNAETKRISLGVKQLERDPWATVAERFAIGTKVHGRVTNLTDYGAFVELMEGIEGLVHVSEMSWTRKNVHPSKILSTSQEVDVVVLDIDPDKRRISLGLKQCSENPWRDFEANFPIGSEVEGEIKNITDFGLFIGLPGDIDGMVHASDLAWGEEGEKALANFKRGDMLRVKVLDVDCEKERVSLGLKQMTEDTFVQSASDIKKGDVVTCTVALVQDNGIEVTVKDDMKGFIRRADLSRDRHDQRTDRFALGEKLDAMVTNIDRASRRITLSIKALELDEEKKAMAEYGSSDSGASLGDILGVAMSAREAAAGKDKA